MTISMLNISDFENVISLGVDCRVRFQIARHFNHGQAVPPIQIHQTKANDFQMMQGTHLFDWNITWFHDVVRGIDHDFERLFELKRLIPSPKHSDVIIDGEYGYQYFHLFHSTEGLSFYDILKEQYDSVAPKVFYLRDKLLAHLLKQNKTLYIRCDGSEPDAHNFCKVLKRKYPNHRFHLILVNVTDKTNGFVSRFEDYSIYEMTNIVDKPVYAQWTGDDTEWTRLFTEWNVNRVES